MPTRKPKYPHLNCNIELISDTETMDFVKQLLQVRDQEISGHVLHVIGQSLHPAPSYKRRPFKRDEFTHEYILLSKVDNFIGRPLYRLFKELVDAFKPDTHIEKYHRWLVFSFLNSVVPSQGKSPKAEKNVVIRW